ncbi:MAG TPA: cupin domain-containing protein [Candidatus Saccharimonadales bacterium]|nr:cupin domain-containing protein [Candidatus Saccharimonadales bacterium]
MNDYTVVKLADVKDVLGDYPGEMQLMKDPLQTEQVAVTYRRMPAGTGAKGGYGHKHKTQEEVVFVFSGNLQVKVRDEVIELGPKSAIRIAPNTPQGLWNEGPEDVELLIISNRVPDLMAEFERVENFWPTT